MSQPKILETFPIFFLSLLIVSCAFISLFLILPPLLNEDNSFSWVTVLPSIVLASFLFMAFRAYNHRFAMYAEEHEIRRKDLNNTEQIIALNRQVIYFRDQCARLHGELNRQSHETNSRQKANQLPSSKDLHFKSNPAPQDTKIKQVPLQRQQNRSNFHVG